MKVVVNFCTLIKNVSSSTSHKRNFVFTSFRLSLREFRKIISNTCIYESILIKIYMNANIMHTQIFNLIKNDLNGHWRSQKITFKFISTITYVLMDNFLSFFKKIEVDYRSHKQHPSNNTNPNETKDCF